MKDNTDQKQAIPLRSARQTQNDRSCRGILKQFEKQTPQEKTYIHSERLNNVLTGNSTSDIQQESTQHSRGKNCNQRKITVNRQCK